MHTIQAVIGSLYGDEGKGLITDYYANQNPDAVVVRINGGGQSGHTVHTPDHKHHIFAHFGSGSFNGNSTYLSHNFVLNPLTFKKEHEAFVQEFNIQPTIYIHPDCLVTTPYDMLLNHSFEKIRDGERHGSCGTGFGETLERNMYQDFTLNVHNLIYSSKDEIRKKLEKIRWTYIEKRLSETGWEDKLKDADQYTEFVTIAHNDDLLGDFVDAYTYMLDNTSVLKYQKLWRKDLILEGGQGLLLDQNYGHFPHVSRSDTGMKSAMMVLNELPHYPRDYELTVNYVTRSYVTRHGAGPLLHEGHIPHRIIDNTNITNEWQQSLRFAPFNYPMYKSVTDKDFALHVPRNAKRVNIMTCMDQLTPIVPVYWDDEYQMVTSDEFKTRAREYFHKFSYGPTREDIV